MSEKSFDRLLSLTLAIANYPPEEPTRAETKVHAGLIVALRRELEALGLDWRRLDAQAQRVRQEAMLEYTAALVRRYERAEARTAERLREAMKAAREHSRTHPGPVEVYELREEGGEEVE